MERRALLRGAAAMTATAWATPTVLVATQQPARALSAGGACPTPVLTAFDGSLSFKYAGQLLAGADLTENDASPWTDDNAGFVFLEQGPTAVPAGGLVTQKGTIPAGTFVCSFIVHASATSGAPRYRANIRFPGSTVLGAMLSSANLAATDGPWGVAGVNYNGRARSHEARNNPGGTGDYWGMPSADSVDIRMAVGDCCTDQTRLFVACI